MDSRTLKGREDKNELFSNIKYVYAELFLKYPRVKWMLPLSIILAVLLPVIGTFIPAVAVDQISNGYGIRSFLLNMAMISLLYLLCSCLYEYSHQWESESNSWLRFIDFGKKIIHKAITMDYSHLEPQKMQQRMTKGSWGIQWEGIQEFNNSVRDMVINFLGIVSYLTVIVILDYRIFLIIVIMSIFNILSGKYAREYMKTIIDENAKINQKIGYMYNLCTAFENGKDIRMYSLYHWFQNVFTRLCKDGVAWQQKNEKRWCIPKVCDVVFSAIRDIVSYYILITLVVDGKMSVAAFTAYLGIISGFSQWIMGATSAYSKLQKCNINVGYYREIVQLKDDYPRGKGLKFCDVEKNEFTIEFDNVSFCYEEAKKATLSNFNLKVKAGEKIALVGNNGAGKTTIVKLLCGFYHPTSGCIKVAGHDITEYDPDEYFKIIGAVFQDIEPLKFMISQNVSGKSLDKTDSKRLLKSLKQANIYDRIMSLKHKENTYISQRFSADGVELSGGETQRLMLARALYKDAPILVLDEPTAALDAISESKIYSEYNAMTCGKTSIFISHRMASTRFCDRIVYLNEGSIAEEGTHEELMLKNGYYAKLFDIQSRHYKDTSNRL